jgi:hypothetical protein
VYSAQQMISVVTDASNVDAATAGALVDQLV